MDTLATVISPIHREGYRFVAIFAVVTFLLFLLWAPLGWLGVLATVFCVYFFRDPPRVAPVRAGLVLSPADGLVQMIEPAVPPAELDMGTDPRPRVSIFMRVTDVHVNRVPADGTIVRQAYRRGKFLNAHLDKASEENERNAIRMQTADGHDIAFVQIAGLVARRIVSELTDGQAVRAGERFGLIRFGSRLDVYLEPESAALVIEGQRVVAGETVLADFSSDEESREGEVR